jgi:hypothetical protein
MKVVNSMFLLPSATQPHRYMVLNRQTPVPFAWPMDTTASLCRSRRPTTNQRAWFMAKVNCPRLPSHLDFLRRNCRRRVCIPSACCAGKCWARGTTSPVTPIPKLETRSIFSAFQQPVDVVSRDVVRKFITAMPVQLGSKKHAP